MWVSFLDKNQTSLPPKLHECKTWLRPCFYAPRAQNPLHSINTGTISVFFPMTGIRLLPTCLSHKLDFYVGRILFMLLGLFSYSVLSMAFLPLVSFRGISSVSGLGWTSWAVLQSWLSSGCKLGHLTWHLFFPRTHEKKNWKIPGRSYAASCSWLPVLSLGGPWRLCSPVSVHGLDSSSVLREHVNPISHTTPFLKVAFPKLRIRGLAEKYWPCVVFLSLCLGES